MELMRLVDEVFGGHVADAAARVAGEDLGPDCMQKVRLAEAGAAVEEERVVRPAGVLRHRLRRRAGELVGWTGTKVEKV